MLRIEDMPGEPLGKRTSEGAESYRQAEPPLTPQMFMRFFNQGGTREAVVQAPLEFTPPAASRGSSATYTVK